MKLKAKVYNVCRQHKSYLGRVMPQERREELCA